MTPSIFAPGLRVWLISSLVRDLSDTIDMTDPVGSSTTRLAGSKFKLVVLLVFSIVIVTTKYSSPEAGLSEPDWGIIWNLLGRIDTSLIVWAVPNGIRFVTGLAVGTAVGALVGGTAVGFGCVGAIVGWTLVGI